MVQRLSPPGALLYERLRPVAQVLSQRSRRLAHLVRAAMTEVLTWPDFIHNCEVACFYAFERLGGDPRYPDDFLWENCGIIQRSGKVVVSSRSPFLREAQNYLNEELQGAHTVYGDYRARHGCNVDSDVLLSGKPLRHGGVRKQPAPGMWNCWDSGAIDRDPMSDLPELMETLQSVLNDKELHFVNEVYIKGKRPRDVAKEYAPTDPKYGPEGWQRAEHMIQKTVTRALKKAEQRLDSRWHTNHKVA